MANKNIPPPFVLKATTKIPVHSPHLPQYVCNQRNLSIYIYIVCVYLHIFKVMYF